MYSKGKYITGEIDGIACAVCFTEVVDHARVRALFSELWGAGFFHVTDDAEMPSGLGVSCYGKSVGLQLDSNPARDTLLVLRALGLAPR